VPVELAPRARSVAQAFRLGMNGQASAALAEVIDGLLAALGHDPRTAVDLAPLLAELGQAQQRGDWLALADTLEFELVPALFDPK
jgi:hypothetical protein